MKDIPKNTKRLGKLQKEMLAFGIKYPFWHAFSFDPTMKRVRNSLIDRGLIEVNQFNQFKVINREIES